MQSGQEFLAGPQNAFAAVFTGYCEHTPPSTGSVFDKAGLVRQQPHHGVGDLVRSDQPG
jgi:hypothetical protein